MFRNNTVAFVMSLVLATTCLCEASGNLIFTDGEALDVPGTSSKVLYFNPQSEEQVDAILSKLKGGDEDLWDIEVIQGLQEKYFPLKEEEGETRDDALGADVIDAEGKEIAQAGSRGSLGSASNLQRSASSELYDLNLNPSVARAALEVRIAELQLVEATKNWNITDAEQQLAMPGGGIATTSLATTITRQFAQYVATTAQEELIEQLKNRTAKLLGCDEESKRERLEGKLAAAKATQKEGKQTRLEKRLNRLVEVEFETTCAYLKELELKEIVENPDEVLDSLLTDLTAHVLDEIIADTKVSLLSDTLASTMKRLLMERFEKDGPLFTAGDARDLLRESIEEVRAVLPEKNLKEGQKVVAQALMLFFLDGDTQLSKRVSGK